MYRIVFKRLLDISISFVLIILLFPLFIILALLVRRDGGPAIFKQDRSGYHNKTFKIYKFRSMSVNNNVRNFKKEDMLTSFGKFLKDTSLDELPQLFNILKGDMSIIGPRPWITDYSKFFTKEQMRRLEVKPGLTGLAQCLGRNSISIHDKIKLDIKYVDSISFKTDLYVFFKSAMSVLTKDGSISSKFLIKNELDELKTNYYDCISLKKNSNSRKFTKTIKESGALR